MSRRPSIRFGNRQHGFSLVELMIALALGLFITAGLVYVYVGSKTSYVINDALSRVQENGRFAIQFLAYDIRMAGYNGCAKDVGRLTNTLNDTASDFLWNFDTAIQGFDANASSWSPALDASIPAPAPGTDVITVRHAADTEIPVTAHPGGNPPGSADIKVESNDVLADGDIVMVTDCKDAAIFQITNINQGGTNLVHNTGTSESPGNRTKALGKDYAINGRVTKMETVTFYVADGGDGTNSLWQRRNANDPEELVQGIEDLQILYGEDTNNDRSADRYLSADAVQMDRVVAIRVALLPVTQDEVALEPVPYSFTVFDDPSPGDRRLRREFVTTVNLRNRTP